MKMSIKYPSFKGRAFFVFISCLILSISNCNVINIAGLYPENGDWIAPQMRNITEFAKDLVNT